jgi:hypothetical protein
VIIPASFLFWTCSGPFFVVFFFPFSLSVSTCHTDLMNFLSEIRLACRFSGHEPPENFFSRHQLGDVVCVFVSLSRGAASSMCVIFFFCFVSLSLLPRLYDFIFLFFPI